MPEVSKQARYNEMREKLVDVILKIIIDNGNYTLDQHRRIIDESGNIVFGGDSNENPIVVYQQDFQPHPSSTDFSSAIENIVECFWDDKTSTYFLDPTIDMFVYYDVNDIIPGENILNRYPTIVPEIAYEEYDNVGNITHCPTADHILVNEETLNQLSNFISLQSLKTIIDGDDAREILDTTIFELLPKASLRQDQINKFFKDYGNLKPPIPPTFDSDGDILNESSSEYDDIGGSNNPEGSISSNKENGYITRVDDNVDADNVNKSLEWLRDDLNNYLRDIDNKITDIEDERPE